MQNPKAAVRHCKALRLCGLQSRSMETHVQLVVSLPSIAMLLGSMAVFVSVA